MLVGRSGVTTISHTFFVPSLFRLARHSSCSWPRGGFGLLSGARHPQRKLPHQQQEHEAQDELGGNTSLEMRRAASWRALVYCAAHTCG